ncbi:hypothetical protein Godav_025224 [Gossypium davidsonii]|uniref:DUF7745 domain-containing protein n=1 Tax=Gossypium davidsonii TaxID=34287 RepID=A0A7J8TB36_GOSDV|nr:hypothetical protein [Gossypium davidsonii]
MRRSKFGQKRRSGRKGIVWLKDIYIRVMGLHPYQCNPEQFARGFAVPARYKGRQTLVLGSHTILELRLQLFYIRKSRLSTYYRRIYGFTSVCKDASRQSLLESSKSTDLSKKLMNITEEFERCGPSASRWKNEAVTDLFDRLDKGVTPVPAILAETFRSLNAYRRVFSENYSPLKEVVATPRRNDISMEKWMAILQNLQEEDIEWRAQWLLLDEILYRCGAFDWVPLLGIWEAVGYASLLVLR